MDAPTLAALAACVGAIAAVIAAVRSVLNGRQNTVMHLTMNSRLTQMVEAIKEQARLEGAAEARATDKIDPIVTAVAAAKVLATAEKAASDRAIVPPAGETSSRGITI
jgi:hypothetical protein